MGEGGRVADSEQRGRKVRHLWHHEWATVSSRMTNVGYDQGRSTRGVDESVGEDVLRKKVVGRMTEAFGRSYASTHRFELLN